MSAEHRMRERASVIEVFAQIEREADAGRWPLRRTPTGVPIGHGLLADHAAEPVEFARLLHHLEQEHMVTDRDCDREWHDTIPTAPGMLDATTGRWPACGRACAKEGTACPRPRACWHLADAQDDGLGVIHGLVWASGPTLALAALVLLFVWFA